MINETNQLSEREREILRLVATGLSNQQIANQLGISINTVKVHLRNVFGKIGVASRTEATLYALRSGIVAVEAADVPAMLPSDEPVLVQAEDAPALPPSQPLTAAVPPGESVVPAPETTAEMIVPAVLDSASAPAPPELDRADLSAAPVPRLAEPVPHEGRRRRGLLRSALGLLGLLLFGTLMIASAHALGWIEVRALSTVGGSVDPATPSAAADQRTRWQELPALPEPRAAFAVASLSDQIYVIGGENQDGVLGSVVRYDVGFEAWASLSDKPTPVSDARAVVLGEKIYVPGGRGSSDPGDVVAAFERYDPRTESWEKLRDMPQPRSGYALATAEGRLYLFGGWDGARYRQDVFEYDPGRDEWQERTPMPTARAYGDAAVVDASIYVLGGENESGPLATSELYFPAREGEQPWVRRPPMPQARSRFGAVGVSSPSVIYIIGGDQAMEPLQYNADTDRWQPLVAPARPIGSQPGVIQQDTTIVTLGGKLDASTYSETMQRYQALYTLPLLAP